MILFLSLLQFSRQSQFKSSSSVFVCFLFMFCDMFVIYYCTLLLVIFLCSQSLSFPKIQFSFHLFYPSCEILLLNSVTSGFDWHISSSYEAVYRSTSLDSMNNKTKHETRHTWLHKETTSLRSHNAPPREHVVFVRTCFCWAHKTSDGEVPPDTHPYAGLVTMGRGLTRSVSNRTRRWLPSSCETSMVSRMESVQKRRRATWSTAMPSGLWRSGEETASNGGPDVGIVKKEGVASWECKGHSKSWFWQQLSFIWLRHCADVICDNKFV